ncbi:MAG: polyphosphate kinase 1 [Bacteroidia bacterium]|nr:polyphosphate kinase 1 [Bacteroidia bacterium]
MKVDATFIDRELSWISFNGRVLQEAADTQVPLYERLKFLAIFSSNLDEYFRVRVAGLRSLLSLGKKKQKAMEIDPAALLRLIYREVDRQQQLFGEVFRDLLPRLAAVGTPLVQSSALSEQQREWLLHYARRTLLPLLDCAALGKNAETDFFRNRVLYLVLRIRREDGPPSLERVEIPTDRHPRFVELPEEEGQRPVVFLDDVVRLILPDLYPGATSIEAWSVKLNRDADLRIEDEFSGDLVKKIREALKLRESGVPSRFLYDPEMPNEVLRRVRRACGLAKEDLFPGGRYHNYFDFFSFPQASREDLRDRPQPPLAYTPFERSASLFEAVAVRDHLLHFPYQRFDYVARWLEEAALDDAVSEICITLYRIAGNSRIAQALLEAVRRGKRVFVFMEIKARFDEEANLQWADTLKEAGASIAYSIPGLKVHAKLFHILRTEQGQEKGYAYLGTGNFNEKTAALYADHGLFTADAEITADVEQVFTLLKDGQGDINFDTLLVAQYNLRDGITERIAREREKARAGKPCSIIMKMNSLEDPKIARRLLAAAKDGVPVRLLVRGICVLVPEEHDDDGVLTATSVIDRYLEHARVYIFGRGEEEEIWLSSADMMRRNLNRRIEVAFPIRDPRLKAQLRRIIEIQRADCVKARRLTAGMSNQYVHCEGGEPLRSQEEIYLFLQTSSTEPGHSQLDGERLTPTDSIGRD